MLEAQLQVSDESELLFTTPTGRMWRERNFYRDLWRPAQEASGLDIRPHECRHSYVTQLRAGGVDDADLAEDAGHSVEIMLSRYTHAVAKDRKRSGRLLVVSPIQVPGRHCGDFGRAHACRRFGNQE